MYRRDQSENILPIAEFCWDIFISYPSQDRARAEEFYTLLPERFRLFLDSRCLNPGDDWPRCVAEALSATRVTAILVSTSTASAHYQAEECARAIGYSRDWGKGRRVVPVYLDGLPARTDWNLFGLNVLQGIGVPESGGMGGAARRLVDALETEPRATSHIDEAHILQQFPHRLVERHEIDEKIIEAYARTFNQTRAELFLDKVNAFRLQADADATLIETMDLRPISNVQPITWWHSVFTDACLHGARMVAALLLTTTRYELPENTQILRERLLNSLRVSTLQHTVA